MAQVSERFQDRVHPDLDDRLILEKGHETDLHSYFHDSVFPVHRLVYHGVDLFLHEGFFRRIVDALLLAFLTDFFMFLSLQERSGSGVAVDCVGFHDQQFQKIRHCQLIFDYEVDVPFILDIERNAVPCVERGIVSQIAFLHHDRVLSEHPEPRDEGAEREVGHVAQIETTLRFLQFYDFSVNLLSQFVVVFDIRVLVIRPRLLFHALLFLLLLFYFDFVIVGAHDKHPLPRHLLGDFHEFAVRA